MQQKWIANMFNGDEAYMGLEEERGLLD